MLQEASRWPQDRPRWLSRGNLGPTWAQVGSKLPRDGPKLAPCWVGFGNEIDAKSCPNGTQHGSKHDSKMSTIWIASRSILGRFWVVDLNFVLGTFFARGAFFGSTFKWDLLLGVSTFRVGSVSLTRPTEWRRVFSCFCPAQPSSPPVATLLPTQSVYAVCLLPLLFLWLPFPAC